MFRIIIIFLTIVILACQSKPGKPAGILGKEEMVLVLADVYISEEKVSRLGLAADSGLVVGAVLRSKALQRLNVSDSVFARSFDYYMDHPREMEEIYSVLVDTLQLREQRSTTRMD